MDRELTLIAGSTAACDLSNTFLATALALASSLYASPAPLSHRGLSLLAPDAPGRVTGCARQQAK